MKEESEFFAAAQPARGQLPGEKPDRLFPSDGGGRQRDCWQGKPDVRGSVANFHFQNKRLFLFCLGYIQRKLESLDASSGLTNPLQLKRNITREWRSQAS